MRRPALLLVLLMAGPGACGDDPVAPPAPVRAAQQGHVDALEAELVARTWDRIGGDGVAGAVWVIAELRAASSLVEGLAPDETASLLALGVTLDGSLRRLERIRAGASAEVGPALERTALAVAALQGRLTAVAALQPGPTEAAPDARETFETVRPFGATGSRTFPTPATLPVAVVGALEVEPGCVDAAGSPLPAPAVQVANALTGALLAFGDGATTATLAAPTWVAASLHAPAGAQDAAVCEVLISGVRPGLAGVPLPGSSREAVTLQLDTLESELRAHELAVRERVMTTSHSATHDLFAELGRVLAERRRLLLHFRLLVSLDAPSADEEEVARKRQQQLEEQADEMLEEAKKMAEDARDSFAEALRVLMEVSQRESEVVKALDD